MKLSKWHIIIGAVIAFVIFGSTLRIFPDPYHEEDAVTLFTWLYREVHEIIHGEHEGGE